jgi:hypothetical protein
VADELLPVDALEDVAGGTDPQRLVEVVLVVVHGQQDDFRVRILRGDLPAQVKAAFFPDAYIAQHDIGTLLGNYPQRHRRRRRLTDDHDLLGEVAEHGIEPMQHYFVVVDEHETQWSRRSRMRYQHAAKPTALSRTFTESHPVLHPRG